MNILISFHLFLYTLILFSQSTKAFHSKLQYHAHLLGVSLIKLKFDLLLSKHSGCSGLPRPTSFWVRICLSFQGRSGQGCVTKKSESEQGWTTLPPPPSGIICRWMEEPMDCWSQQYLAPLACEGAKHCFPLPFCSLI